MDGLTLKKILNMNRNILKNIEKILDSPQRKPLVLAGAAQVGKTTLIQQVAAARGQRLVTINLRRHGLLGAAFSSMDPPALRDLLESLPGVSRLQPGDLVFFDELQAVPEALGMLARAQEAWPELQLVAAGNGTLPGGGGKARSRNAELLVGPLSFSEFLLALEEAPLATAISAWQPGQTLHYFMHQRLVELWRVFCMVGGMPEAVQLYASSRSLNQVRELQLGLLQHYRDDFPRLIGGRNALRFLQVFDTAAATTGEKVRYSRFSAQDTSATIRADLDLLCQARLLNRVVHCPFAGTGAESSREERAWRLLFLDIGLMHASCGTVWQPFSARTETALVNADGSAWQFVGQHLLGLSGSGGQALIEGELRYWQRQGRSGKAAVDYVLDAHGTLLPVAVKAGATGTLKALMQFVAEQGLHSALRFDLQPPQTVELNSTIRRGAGLAPVSFRLISLPLYLVEALPVVLDSFKTRGQLTLL